MRKLLIFDMRYVLATWVLALASALSLSAQQPTYEITRLVAYKEAALNQALQNCQLDAYRKVNARTVLNFENGTQVSLLSVEELRGKGLPTNEAIALADNQINKNVFVLHTDGYILEKMNPAPSLYQQKINEDKKGGQ